MKVSIITATYNSAGTVRDTIESVNRQTYADMEHIIVDGASTDNTLELVTQYGKRVSKVISEPDKGIYDAMNKGIQAANGDVIAILNSDDFYIADNIIEQVVNAFEENKTDTVYTNLYVVEQENTSVIVRNATFKPLAKKAFFNGWHPPHSTLFVKRAVYERYGLFDTRFFIASDYDFMLRIFEVHNATAYYLPVYAIKMRNGGASMKSLKNILLAQRECLQAFRKYNLKVNRLRYFVGRYCWKLSHYSVKTFLKDIKNKQ